MTNVGLKLDDDDFAFLCNLAETKKWSKSMVIRELIREAWSKLEPKDK
jgi:predicted transcriptional regulator